MESKLDPKSIPYQSSWEDLLKNSAVFFNAQPDLLAFADPFFLLSPETRAIRFQLEFQKADLILQKMGINQTLSVFGSARTLSVEIAQKNLDQTQLEFSKDDYKLSLALQALKNAQYYEKARKFSYLVASHFRSYPAPERYYICTGGGPGIMEAANRGAFDAGSSSIGLSITLPKEQSSNSYVTPELNFKFHYFAIRKMHFIMRAKAFVAFPGGFGTLDELFEMLTLVQCHKTEPIPILLFGTDYWRKLLNFEVLAEHQYINKEDLKLFQYVDSEEEAFEVLLNFYK